MKNVKMAVIMSTITATIVCIAIAAIISTSITAKLLTTINSKEQQVQQPRVEENQPTQIKVSAKEAFTKEHINNMSKMCNQLDDEIEQLFLVSSKMKGGEITTKKQLLDEYTRIDNDVRKLINEDFSNIRKSDNETRDGGIELVTKIAKDLDTSIVRIKAIINQQNLNMNEYGNEYDFIAEMRENIKIMKDALEKAK